MNISIDFYFMENDYYIIRMTEVNGDNIVISKVFENSPFALWIKDRDGKYQYINKKLEYLNDKSIKETLGKNDYELWGTKMGKKHIDEDEYVMSTRKVYSYQGMFWVAPLKKDVVYEITKWPYKDRNNNILGTIGIAIEIVDEVELRRNLTENQEAFESIINYSEEVFIISDRKKQHT